MAGRTKAQRLAAHRAAQEAKRAQSPAASAPVTDSYQNFPARVGVGTGNLGDGGSYGFNPVSRERAQLEYMYRGSWIVGAAVDAKADDMVAGGIDYDSTMPPDDIDILDRAMGKLQIWQCLGDTIRWARLYGGAGAILMIDGQDFSTPLRPETVGQGQFKGLFVVDRWMIQPSFSELITDLGPDIGKPKFYRITVNAPALMGVKVHYSRFLRFDGVRLPYYQRIAEMGWGMSVVERLYDRLLAFDSATQGAAQLIYKAHYRTMSVEGLRQILAAGGPAEAALLKNMDMIRQGQSTEGMSIIDAKDKFESTSYSFAGLSDMIAQFGSQISGAIQTPIVRLFGQSPAGFSTGDTDLRNYYDGIETDQESKLRVPVSTVLDVMSRSELGKPLPEGSTFKFKSLWKMTDKERSEILTANTTAIVGAIEADVIDKATGLKELRQQADVTGVFGSITDGMIKEAEMEPPTPGEIDDPEAGGENLAERIAKIGERDLTLKPNVEV